MTIDLQYYSQRIDEWYDNKEFYELRTAEQLGQLLELCELDIKKFSKMSKHINKCFDDSAKLEIIQHAKLTYGTRMSNVFTLIEIISKLLNINILREAITLIKTRYTETQDSKQQNISGEESSPKAQKSSQKALQSRTSEENLQNLKRLTKVPENVPIFYEILQDAVAEGDEVSIKYAVEDGICDIRHSSNLHPNLVLISASQGNLALVELLHKFGADIQCKDDFDHNILHKFAQTSSLEGVKFALKFIDVNSKTATGLTALHIAALNEQPEICEYLLSLPETLKNEKDYEDATPLACALIRENYKVVDILRNHDCKL